MYFLLTVNVFLVIFGLSSAIQCCAPVLTKAIGLFRDFEALHVRACDDVKININAYRMMSKTCIKDLVLDIGYSEITDLAFDFIETNCFKKSTVYSCSDDEYTKFKHCAVDFGLAHLEDLLEIYKNCELVTKVYKFVLKSKACVNKSLDEIEANFHVENIHV